MLKFTYKLTIRERIEAKCKRHPRYNPEKHRRGGIQGGCSTCWNLYDVHNARLTLDAAVHEFTRKAGPWTKTRAHRLRKAVDTTTATDKPEVE